MAKPILFNTDMVKAILEGRKTVTRRLIKPQPKTDSTVTLFSTFDYADISYDGVLKLSPYQPGDILYVRETWAKVKGESRYLYKADKVDFIYKELHSSWKWKPSIHMPKEAARIFLRVTNVSVAKLQDITEEQAKAEGVRKIYDDMTDEEYKDFMRRTPSENPNKKKEDWGYDNYLWHGHGHRHIPNYKIEKWDYQYSAYESARDSFSSLWESTVSCKDEDKYGWDANPFCWVISFERISKDEAMQ